jgi:diketogulonate reductase-like aldo/keto reductase
MADDFPEVTFTEMGKTGEKVSAIGLGTYGIADYKKGEEAFIYAIERGINLIDTAEIYNTEDFVGRIIKKVGRERLFITTKVHPKNLASKESTIKAARGSMSRLGTDSVDLILIHWPHNTMSIGDQIKNIEAVQKEGLARHIGVSNFSVKQMQEARDSTSSAEVVCNQVKYNLDERDIEKDIIPFCERNEMSVVAYTPIGRGGLYKSKEMKQVTETNGKTPIQVALNFLMRKPRVIPIPKTEKIEHMKEILGAMGWKMSDQEVMLFERGVK